MSVQILIGLKQLSSAKQRLMRELSPAERRSLMITMLTTVTAAARAAELGPVALATSEPDALSLASALEVDVVSDGGLPWNEGLVYALNRVAGIPSAVLYLAGDLPLLQARDLLDFVEAAPSPGVAVARARDGGSNALLVKPAHALSPMFGRPRSSEVHRATAVRLGLTCQVVDIVGLALDVDTIEDAWDSGLVARVIETGRGPGRG
jgi:2-phospho-L-lactate/phosphoenolpyruvate guanylyltransferase